MQMIDILMRKRNGAELTDAELKFVIDEYTANKIPDYQMSAFLMAIYFQDMTVAERANLTNAFMHSGDVLDLTDIPGIKVDKHSTGGVGDKTSLPLAPMVAALGIPVPMISGRGLGHTGGTLDKLEAIPGFRVDLSETEFKQQIKTLGLAIIGATGQIAPADKKIYALRDVTATVDSIPLIASSIMSKKLATGNDALVLDIKTGAGAFMKTLDQARELAQALIEIGHTAGKQVEAVISDMNQPLGLQIGNTLEIIETIEMLKGRGPADLVELCLTLGAKMVVMGGKANDETDARAMLAKTLVDGTALAKFKAMIVAQGGEPAVIDDYQLMPTAKYQTDILANRDGVVATMQADAFGVVSMRLGGGRQQKDDQLDYAVGITLHKKIGDAVANGESLLTIHSNQADVTDIVAYLTAHIEIADTASVPSLIHETL
ncbi:MAG: pyrimidine-nucleoside phosphorylase [Lactobacillaceae bacterium]|jgi:pyrimidine-nucleoside phosphorylase|nr:pyrimidine-nucleoside phosphorylase [Lactobacillaceae bacterium]